MGGGHKLFCHLSGEGRVAGVLKIFGETGGRKNFGDSNENVPDPPSDNK